MLVCIIGAAVAQFTQKDAHENLLYDVALQVAGLGFVIAMLCFAAIALATINKTSSNTTAQAIGTTLLKVLLYVFLPAVVITIVLTLIFVLPWYQ